MLSSPGQCWKSLSHPSSSCSLLRMSGLVIIQHLLVNLADCFPFFNVSVIYLFTCVTSSSGLITLACK